MAAERTELLRLGPFKGVVGLSTAGPYSDPSRASAAANVDIRRSTGALVTALGRKPLATLMGTGSFLGIAQMEPDTAQRYVVASLSEGTMRSYEPDTGLESLVSNGVTFTQAVPFGAVLFTNAGQQVVYSNVLTPLAAFKWQYTVTDTGLAISSVVVNAAGTVKFDYAITVTVHPPQAEPSGGPNQESTQFGATPPPGAPNPLTGNSTATPDITLNAAGGNIWSGVTADGAAWFANVYRRSANQPIWYLLASGSPTSSAIGTLTNGTPYHDTATDASIAGNAQLQFYQDPPPVSTSVPCAIFSHKERMFVFTVVQSALTDNTPQCQLWYSGYGIPWQFDAVNQVLLVGNDGTPNIGASPTFGDLPIAGVSLSSVGVLHKRKTLWILYGDDPLTFIVRKVGNYGTVSEASVAVCQGIDHFLTEEGVFAFDGANAPQYLSERIKDRLAALPKEAWQNSVGWFANRSYYLSFPNEIAAPPAPTQEFSSGAYAGTASVSNTGGTQTTEQPTETATTVVNCRGTLHKPDPYAPDTWFWLYTCSAGTTTPADWAVPVTVAPTDAPKQLTFTPSAIDGSVPGDLKLIAPDGTTVLHDFGDINVGQTYVYFNAAAIVGTYTWRVTCDVSDEVGSDLDNNPAATYSVTVTPTTTTSTGGPNSSEGVHSSFATHSALAPVAAGTELSLAISSVVLPADANGSTSLTVQLTNPLGQVVASWTGLTMAQTLTYSGAAAIAGIYTWTVWAVPTVLGGGGSSSYDCSCSLDLSWWALVGSANVIVLDNDPVTFIYHLPSQEWFIYPYCTGSVISEPAESPLGSAQLFNSVIGAKPASLEIDSWEAAESDLGLPVAAMWTGPLSDSGAPGIEKSYDVCYISAPIQAANAQVMLEIDPGVVGVTKTFSWTIDLSKGPTSAWQVPHDEDQSCNGFLGRLTVRTQSVDGSPVTIYSVGVHGSIKYVLVPRDNEAVTSP